ncbi:hypothetical protein Tco_0767553 [Tanacetum coccineum]
METMAENVVAAVAEKRPPILEKGMYDSWKTRIWIYIKGRENGERLIDSIKNGPFEFKKEITISGVNGALDEKLFSSSSLCKEKPNGKLIYNSILNGLYVRRMIPEPGDQDSEVPIAETFHEQTDEELTENKVKQMEADDQAIQTIHMGLPEDIYAAVDSCETA